MGCFLKNGPQTRTRVGNYFYLTSGARLLRSRRRYNCPLVGPGRDAQRVRLLLRCGVGGGWGEKRGQSCGSREQTGMRVCKTSRVASRAAALRRRWAGKQTEEGKKGDEGLIKHEARAHLGGPGWPGHWQVQRERLRAGEGSSAPPPLPSQGERPHGDRSSGLQTQILLLGVPLLSRPSALTWGLWTSAFSVSVCQKPFRFHAGLSSAQHPRPRL